MAAVEFRSVGKVFPGGVTALRDFTVTAEDGSFLVLVGPSGCGKSTSLRILAGLETPTSGSVWIGGRDVTDVSPQDRDIAMVFQNYALYPHMTVFDNMAFALRMRRIPGPEMNRRVEEAAGILEITALLGRKPRELSGGQRQRVALGRAIVRKPSVFLFDEPLSNLDAKLRVQMRSELARIHHRLGSTMIYVTHDQAEAMTLGDRIVVLRDGLIQQLAAPLELYDRPVNSFVAGFIGSPAMNFLELAGGGAGRAGAVSSGQDLPEGAARIGIRPEDVVPLQAGPVSCVAEVVEILGNEKIVYMRTDTGEPIVMRCDPSVEASVGSVLRLGFRPGRCHFFGAGGERLVK